MGKGKGKPHLALESAGAALQCSPSSVPYSYGEMRVAVTGSGFTPGSIVILTIHGTGYLWQVTSDAEGDIETHVQQPDYQDGGMADYTPNFRALYYVAAHYPGDMMNAVALAPLEVV